MPTGFYLLDHPNPNYPQFGAKRRNGAVLSGVVDLHTAESQPDWLFPDTGAEGVAAYIARRTTPGSYHEIDDADSRVRMAPWEYETWHDRFTNNHAVGFSAATKAALWDEAPADWREATVRNMARGAAEFAQYLRGTRGILVPARLLTATQAHGRIPGFVYHGTSDPTRRSDPGREFPIGQFFAFYQEFLTVPASSPSPAPAPKPAPPKGRKFLPLVLDGDEGHRTITEEERAWARTGDYRGVIEEDAGRLAVRGDYLETAEQRYLKRKGWYRGEIDADFGQMSITSEQRWLKSLGLYTGLIEADKGLRAVRGPLTIAGLQAALNQGKVK